MCLLASGSDASSNPSQVSATVAKQSATLNPGIDPSIFHSANPAFPFLFPGKTAAIEPKTKSMFNRVCFRFIYAITVNVTKSDDPAVFFKLFNHQCVGGDNHKCGQWSDDLLQAVRKKMGAVKLLGKDGHIGRSKKKSADEALEAHLPPTLTGVTSYANWCNRLHKELAIVSSDSQDGVMKEITKNTSKVLTLKIRNGTGVNSTNAMKAQVTQVAQKTDGKTRVTKAVQKPVQPAHPMVKNIENAKEGKGCFCFHRGSKKICNCDEVKQSDEGHAFENVGSKLKGAGIAEQMSQAPSNDRELDDVAKMLHTARAAAERHAHKK